MGHVVPVLIVIQLKVIDSVVAQVQRENVHLIDDGQALDEVVREIDGGQLRHAIEKIVGDAAELIVREVEDANGRGVGEKVLIEVEILQLVVAQGELVEIGQLVDVIGEEGNL